MADFPGETERISLYIRVAGGLRSRISAGEWAPGARMPTVDDLAEEYGVARVTIRHALEFLARDGLVTSTRGRGTYVCEAQGDGASSSPARRAAHDRLEFSPGDRVRILSRTVVRDAPSGLRPIETGEREFMQIQKIHEHKTSPFAYVDCVVDLDSYRRFPEGSDERFKILRLLLEHGDRPIARGRQEITVVQADYRVASLLNCSIASALVRIRSWRLDEDGRLVFGAITLYRGDRFVYDVAEDNFPSSLTSPLVIPKFRTKKS